MAVVLNRYASNIHAESITLPLIMKMEEEMGIYGPLINPIIKNLYEAMNDQHGGEVKVEGVNNLLQYPEYSDIGAVKDLLSIFDRQEDIVKLVSDADADDVNVYIGSENAVDEKGSSSLIFRTIKRNGEVIGAIGIIGPRRMDYSRVITLIERLAGNISDVVERSALAPPGGIQGSIQGEIRGDTRDNIHGDINDDKKNTE